MEDSRTMLLRKQPFIALVLLLALAGVINAQTQTAQKNKKEKEILSTAPKPVIQLSDHPLILTPCVPFVKQLQVFVMLVKYTGAPLCTLTNPPSSQPPRIVPPTPCGTNFLPFPKGSS